MRGSLPKPDHRGTGQETTSVAGRCRGGAASQGDETRSLSGLLVCLLLRCLFPLGFPLLVRSQVELAVLCVCASRSPLTIAIARWLTKSIRTFDDVRAPRTPPTVRPGSAKRGAWIGDCWIEVPEAVLGKTEILLPIAERKPNSASRLIGGIKSTRRSQDRAIIQELHQRLAGRPSPEACHPCPRLQERSSFDRQLLP